MWRCKDYVLATPMCRSCMRLSHRENPFHRIECWNSHYFQPANLLEVGTYLLVQHHTSEPFCLTLQLLCNQLDKAEEMKDRHEQDQLMQSIEMPVPVPEYQFNMDLDSGGPSMDKINEEYDVDGELDEGEPDLTMPYDHFTHLAQAFASDAFRNYIRVVHSNGIHHIAMVSCNCHGQDILPLDIFAAQLLPASLKRIKTIFTAQVLDMFRLCNLELKASAYQFYQLLRQLTLPMAPAEVINLYREF